MRVLVGDADETAREETALALSFYWRDEAVVLRAATGDEVMSRWSETDPDVVVLSSNLTDRPVLDVIRAIRQAAGTPIVLRGDGLSEVEQIRALEAGVDDIVDDAASPMMLVARINAAARRGRPSGAGREAVRTGDLLVDPVTRHVTRGDEEVELTAYEWRLLDYLVRNAPRLVPQRALHERIWGPDVDLKANNLKALVSRLRGKVSPVGASYIATERGAGYRWVPPVETA